MTKDLYVPKRALEPEPNPQCQAVRTGSYISDTDTTNKQCRHVSRYNIEGHWLCVKHAQQKALELYLENQKGKPRSAGS